MGKNHPDGRTLMPSHGILNADVMVKGLYERLALRISDKLIPPQRTEKERNLIPLATQRSPYFCSGCPHNASTKAPENSLIGAGIGCHTMVLLMDEDRVGDIAGVTAMGNEGMHWIGMEPFLKRDHFLQNIGDGTYFHSGQLTIQSAIAAGSNITFKLLFNGTIAMTGGQDPKGMLGIEEVTKILLAQGVAKIIITTEDVLRYKDLSVPDDVAVWDRSRIIEAQETMANISGVTVLIHDQHCAAELRRSRKRGLIEKPDFRIMINHRICEACGDCGEVSNCLSVQSKETPFGAKTVIDQESCNFDKSCLKGDCPSFLTIEIDQDAKKLRNKVVIDLKDLPKPVPQVKAESLDLRMAGIGGTGVVTTAQIFATAAMLDGFEVRGLDQTGLSQKAGPVMSDVRITRGQPRPSNLLTHQSADVILGFDLLVAASDTALEVSRKEHTVLVASQSETPTGSMVGKPFKELPNKRDLIKRVETRTKASENVYVDAAKICENLLGEATSSNIFLLGVAVQRGVIPIEPGFFEEAISLNGVAVDRNILAFRLGRKWAENPESINSQMEDPPEAPIKAELFLPNDLETNFATAGLSSETIQLVSFFYSDIIEYQNQKCAEGYLSIVAETVERSKELSNKKSFVELIETVVRNMHKLITYKDEYEVARLFILPEIKQEMLGMPQSSGKATWHFHPPFLRSMGLNRKLKVPYGLALPVMRLLSKAKVIRGTRFDPFGYAEIRKIERHIRDEYQKEISEALEVLTEDNFDQVLTLAALPQNVRGFEHIKLERSKKFLQDLSLLSKQLHS